MDLYSFIFVWIVVMAAVSLFVPVKKQVLVEGKWEYRWKKVWAFAVFFPIFYLASQGKAAGDVLGYLTDYYRTPGTWREIRSLITNFKSGNGYKILVNLIKMVFGNNLNAYRVIIAAIHSIPVILIYDYYSSDYLFSVYLFAAAGSHIAWMMNGMRQYLAVVLIFATAPWIIRKKYFPTIIVILVAATIHTSALLMLPVIFIVQGKPWNKRTILFIILAVIGTMVFSQRVELFDVFLEGTEYEGSIAYYQAHGDDGVNPLRVLVSAVAPILALIARRRLEIASDSVINVCVNMSIIGLGINLVAMVTSGIMVGRMPIYVSLYSFILLPYLIKRLFRGNMRFIVTVVTIAFYFLYYAVQR